MKKPAKQHSILYGSVAVPYELVYSKRKTIAIHVYADGRTVVRAPTNTALAKIEEFVLSKAKWIVRHQTKFKERREQTPAHRRYTSGERYHFLGQPYTLNVMQGGERVELDADRLHVYVGDVTDRSRIAHLVDKWYRAQAARILPARLAECFPRVKHWGVAYPPLTIRTMKSRWGSCRSSGKITLNLRLMQVAVDLIDYIILHELCHLREMNHSRAFYALMDSVLPDWREKRKRLKNTPIF
jgi:predicted metal-dependent hydrolase